MPWVPKAKEVKRLRATVGWTAEELAKRAGISDRTLRAIESHRPPATIRDATVADLARALTIAMRKDPSLPDDVRTRGCERTDIASWEDRVGRAAKTAPVPPPATAPLVAAGSPATYVAPHMRVIGERAAVERQTRPPRPDNPGRRRHYPLLGLNSVMECDARYADYDRRRLAG